MLVSLLAVMRKEIQQTLRDRRMTVILFVAPVLQLTVLGFAVDLDVQNVPTVVCDLDRSPESRQLAREFVASGTFTKVAATHDADAASRMLETGQAATALVIPSGFKRDLARNVPTAVQVLVDGTDPNRAQVASSAASQFLKSKGLSLSVAHATQVALAQGRIVGLPQSRLVPRILYNPQLKSAIYMVPGVAAMVLLVVTTVVTAMGIARERELGTMEQILVTPLRPWILLVGKCLPFAAIGLIDVIAILAVGAYVFEVPIRGHISVVLVATVLYLMSTLGAGIFISSMSRSQQQAILGGFFFIMPAILLSGFMTPIENMPAWIRHVSVLNPVRYFVEILRACLLKSAGFADLAPQLLALGIFGIGILAVSALRFRKRLA